jgi:hypothetical protein
MDKVTKIEDLEKKIINEEEEIKEVERRIDAKEEKILATENNILKVNRGLKFIGSGINKYQGKLIRSGFIARLSKHKILYSFITLLSIVLIWSGIQNFLASVPLIHNPLVSIVLGIIIVWIIDKELA